MAKLIQSDHAFIGSIGNLTYYKRKDSDQVFVRTKGGVSKERIHTGTEFVNQRRNNMEFGGCTQMTKFIRATFPQLHHLGDVHLIPGLCALSKRIQQLDQQSAWGERKILLSKYRFYLMGVEFRKSCPIGSLLNVPLECSVERELSKATIHVPAFSCVIALQVPGKQPYFRLLTSLGIVTDLGFDTDNGRGYVPLHDKPTPKHCVKTTEWFSTLGGVPEQELSLALAADLEPLSQEDTLVLSVAVEFGELDALGGIDRVMHVGGGKIVGVG